MGKTKPWIDLNLGAIELPKYCFHVVRQSGHIAQVTVASGRAKAECLNLHRKLHGLEFCFSLSFFLGSIYLEPL